jgi:threonine aldolase
MWSVPSSVTTRTWRAARGRLDPQVVFDLAAPHAGPYLVSTRAIAVEDTHNFGGGTVQDLASMRALRDFADAHDLALHLDGARLWNAHVASGVPLADIGGLFDTASVCLSKGLGAPVGSVLVSTRERIAEARVWRKRYGAGMRQVGILAAAGSYALDHHIERLAEDHARAARIAGIIAGVRPDVVDPGQVDTNIVVLDLREGPAAPALAADARVRGVAVSVLGEHVARLVTHLDVDDEGVDRAGEVLSALLAG